MTLLKKIERIERGINELMNINQSLEDKDTRFKMGFNLLYNLQNSIRWVKEDIEHLF